MEGIVAKWRGCNSYEQYTEVVSSTFRPFVSRVLQGESAATAADFRTRHVDAFDDVRLLTLEALHDFIVETRELDPEMPRKRRNGAEVPPPDFGSAGVQGCLIDLLTGIQLPPDGKKPKFACKKLNDFLQKHQKCARSEGKKRARAEGIDVDKFFTPKAYRRAFTRVWAAVLSLPLSNARKLAIMRAMPDDILPIVSQAWMFSDFLINAFDLGGVYALYALKGLFILMTKHGIDYPHLYTKLYSLLTVDMLHSKIRSRFLELFGLLLTSTRLPAYLVASFIKKSSRLLLVVPAPTMNFLIVTIYNLMKSHPEAMVLVHRTKSMDFQSSSNHTPENLEMLKRLYEGLDPFLDSEPDPSKTNALYSSCWELKIVQEHFFPSVATDAEIFQREMKLPSRDWGPQCSKSYLKFFQKEVMHFDPHRYPAPCTFHEAEGLFDPRGHSSMAWRPGPGWETRALLNGFSSY